MRDIAEEIERLEDGLKELEHRTISSPNMDGMPHGSSQGDAMALLMIHKQRQVERIGNALERFKKAQNAARRIIKDMPASKRLFYEAYYVEHGKHSLACMIARISERTGYRYMQQAGEPDKQKEHP